MKSRKTALFFLMALVLAWMPVCSEAALSDLSFTGTFDWMQGGSNYVTTYEGNTYATGKTITGYLEYDTGTGETKTLWFDVPDQNNVIHRLSAFNGDGPQYYTTTPSYVFEIQGTESSPRLTNLGLTNLSNGSTGTWYFDFDDAEAFRIGGTAQVVPSPAAAWLLASGLVGLVGIRRRFQK